MRCIESKHIKYDGLLSIIVVVVVVADTVIVTSSPSSSFLFVQFLTSESKHTASPHSNSFLCTRYIRIVWYYLLLVKTTQSSLRGNLFCAKNPSIYFLTLQFNRALVTSKLYKSIFSFTSYSYSYAVILYHFAFTQTLSNSLAVTMKENIHYLNIKQQ